MQTKDFDFNLPESLIAQSPIKNRDHSRLMVVKKSTGDISHYQFKDIISMLGDGDLLVMNNTKVIKARLFAKRKSGAKLELFLLEPKENECWTVLIKNSKKLQIGEEIEIAPEFSAELLSKNLEDGHCDVRLKGDAPVDQLIHTHGEIPIPPYVKVDQSQPYEKETFEKGYQIGRAHV